MANRYTFERRAIYYEEQVVEADTYEEAREAVENGDADEINLGEWYDYYDDEYTLINEEIVDPLVDMIVTWDKVRQLDLDFG